MIKKIFKFLDHPHHSEHRSVDFDNKKDYLFLPEIFSVRQHLYLESVSFAFFLLVLFGILVLWVGKIFGVPTSVVISGSIAFFYLLLMIFKLYVVYHAVGPPSPRRSSESEVELRLSYGEVNPSVPSLDEIRDAELPVYTVLVPLYNEARVIPQIIDAISELDYPKDKLDVIITLEEYDHDTQEAIRRAGAPFYFRTLILPNVEPKTKPKALNVAFKEIKGEYVVIYDAEIIPDRDQLKKAYLAFKRNPEYAGFQTRLDHYNANKNLLTRLFNAEFAFYYDLFLPGLQKLNLPIPLSGHSVHFRRRAIQAAGGWDPYNVAEDCDMGIRLYRMGYRMGILDSISREEATETVASWARQRTRWMKGFIQTSIVHLRHPVRFIGEIGGIREMVGFLFVVPGSVFVNIANIFYWILLVGWFSTHSRLIQMFFPGVILTISFTSFVLGNFLFTYFNLISAFKRGRMTIVKWCLLSPLYWLLLSIATVRAFVQIILRPHYWEKTEHGVAEHGSRRLELGNDADHADTYQKEETHEHDEKNYTDIKARIAARMQRRYGVVPGSWRE